MTKYFFKSGSRGLLSTLGWSKTARARVALQESSLIVYTVLSCVTIVLQLCTLLYYCVSIFTAVLHCVTLPITLLHCVTRITIVLHCVTRVTIVLHCVTLCYKAHPSALYSDSRLALATSPPLPPIFLPVSSFIATFSSNTSDHLCHLCFDNNNSYLL